MEAIKDFALTIIIFIFFTSSAQNLINNDGYKRLYRFFVGLILIVIVLGRIFKMGNASIEDILKNEYNENIMEEVESRINTQVEYLSSEAVSEYKEIVRKNIEQIVLEEGYAVNDCIIFLDENSKAVSSIELTISPYISNYNIMQIKDVSVDVAFKEDEKSIYSVEKDVVVSRVICNISAVYGIDSKNIVIYREE